MSVCPFCRNMADSKCRGETHNVTVFAAACLHSTLHVHSSETPRAHSSFVKSPDRMIILSKAFGHVHPSENSLARPCLAGNPRTTSTPFRKPSKPHLIPRKPQDNIYTLNPKNHISSRENPKTTSHIYTINPGNHISSCKVLELSGCLFFAPGQKP